VSIYRNGSLRISCCLGNTFWYFTGIKNIPQQVFSRSLDALHKSDAFIYKLNFDRVCIYVNLICVLVTTTRDHCKTH
jgi:hypothetical protein